MELVGDTMKYKAVKYDCLSRTQQKRNIRGTRWASFGKKKEYRGRLGGARIRLRQQVGHHSCHGL